MGSCNFNNPVRRMTGIAAGFIPNAHSAVGRSIAANFWPFQRAKSPRRRRWKKSKRPEGAATVCGSYSKCWATTEKSGLWPRGARVFLLPRSTPPPHAEALRAELRGAMTALEEMLAKDFRTGQVE